MFTVQVDGETKYMVQLTGPASYRYGELHVRRGGTLTVTKRTRDYLVKSTGFFADYDPTPAEPIEELLPPQMGGDRGPLIDDADLDAKNNPPLTQAEAYALAQQGQSVDQHGKPIDNERGDLTAADIVKPTVTGGATATNAKGKAAAKATAKAKPAGGGVVVKNKPDEATVQTGATTVE